MSTIRSCTFVPILVLALGCQGALGLPTAARTTSARTSGPGANASETSPVRRSKSSSVDVERAWHAYRTAHPDVVQSIGSVVSIADRSHGLDATDEIRAIEAFAASAPQLAALASECAKEPLASTTDTHDVTSARTCCDVAAHRDEKLDAAVQSFTRRAREAEVRRLSVVLENLPTRGTIDLRQLGAALNREAATPLAQRAFSVVHKTPPADYAAPIAVAAAEMTAALKKHADHTPPQAGAANAQAHAVIAANLAAAPVQNANKLVPLRTWALESEWNLDRNDLGVLIGRFKNTRTLTRVEGQPYCLLVQGVIEQDHVANGQFAPRLEGNIDLESFVVSCK